MKIWKFLQFKLPITTFNQNTVIHIAITSITAVSLAVIQIVTCNTTCKQLNNPLVIIKVPENKKQNSDAFVEFNTWSGTFSFFFLSKMHSSLGSTSIRWISNVLTKFVCYHQQAVRTIWNKRFSRNNHSCILSSDFEREADICMCLHWLWKKKKNLR